MTLLTAIGLLGACNPLLLNDNGAENTEFIGYYVETESVGVETWIRIDEDEKNILFAADASGREINIYYNQNGIPVLFYKATPELGRIIGYREIRNDYGSLVYMVNRLSDYAEYVYHSDNADDDVMGYIRSFNSNYCNFHWNIVAGSINADFVRSVREMPHDLLGFEEYFSSFVSRGFSGAEINSSYHNVPDGESDGLRVVDEINQNNMVDVIHMFATLDGIWGTYVAGDHPLNRREHHCSDLEDMCGWAGDLQSELQRQYNHGQYITDFETILNGYRNQNGILIKTSFSTEDFLADQDAFNIASIHGADFSSLKYSINMYFQYGLQIFKWRDYQFTTNLANHNWLHSENNGNQLLKDKIYKYVGIEELSNGSIVEIDSNHPYRYRLVPDLRNINITIRKEFADSFYNYVTSNGTTFELCESTTPGLPNRIIR